MSETGGGSHLGFTKKRQRRVLAIALLVSAHPLLAPAAGAEPTSRGGLHEIRVIKCLTSNISGKRYERPPSGIRGDVVVGRDRLRNFVPQFGKPKGAGVGEDRYRTVFENRSIATVDVTTTLPGGSIHARGRADFRKASSVIRVVGGTGVFTGATGTSEQRVLQGGGTLNIYRLRLPG